MEKAEPFRGDLPLGERVIYYPRGQVNSQVSDTSGPLVGIVHRSGGGQLDLVVFNYRGQPELKKAVYHITHPDLYDEWGQISGAGYRVGSWDFIKDPVSPVVPACPCAIQDCESRIAELTAKVESLEAAVADFKKSRGGRPPKEPTTQSS